MIGRLYADGVMQQTEDFNFTVLQGSCVGGSTTVNNAVCFPPPDRVLRTWNDPHLHDAGLDIAALHASVAAVEEFLPVVSQADAPLNPSAPAVRGGRRRLGPRARPARGGAGERQHRRLPRMRLLQHRVPVRPQDVHARQDAAGGPGHRDRHAAHRGRLRGRAHPHREREPAARGLRAGEARRRQARAGRGGPVHPRRGGRRVELHPAEEQRRERPSGRGEALLQHGRADHGRVRATPSTRSGASRSPTTASRRTTGSCSRLVQPAGGAGAEHARLVRAPLREHAPLSLACRRGRAGGHPGVRPRDEGPHGRPGHQLQARGARPRARSLGG